MAALTCIPLRDSQRILGAFERAVPFAVGRCSGGPPLTVAAGGIYVALSLARHDELVRCEPNQTINRYVRPLLRALTAFGKPASYFGRDWISVAGSPIAWIGAAHRADTGATTVESFVAMNRPFAEARPSFRGKDPSFLHEVYERELAVERVIEKIIDAYVREYGSHVECVVRDRVNEPLRPLPMWTHTKEDAIGNVCAVKDERGAVRIGGELMVSADAVERFERELGSKDVSRAQVEALAQNIFADSRVMMLGTTWQTIADVALAAFE